MHDGPFHIRNRQGEPSPLKQSAQIAAVGEWRDPRRDPSGNIGLCGGKGLTQFA